MKEHLNAQELREHYRWLIRTGTILVNSEDYRKWTKGHEYLQAAKRIAEEQGWN